LLILTTIRRLAIPLLAFLVWTPAAYAWSWPVQGPVLQQFSYDEEHPYAAGQHRGIDIGADAVGESVIAPAAGIVSFAGTVPTNGRSVTIQTADGYSVTLTHLGSIVVAKGATVAERESVGTVGPSGTPEVDGPYVHLGMRHTADPNGYVDPLTLLPPLQTGLSDDGSTSTVSQPSSSPASTAPQTEPAPAPPASTPASTTRGSNAHPGRSHTRTQDRRSQETRTSAQPQRRVERASHPSISGRHEERGASVPHRRPSEPTRSAQRPVVETVAHEPSILDAGHEIRPSAQPPATPKPDVLVPLTCNGAAALVALAAAFAAARRRRRAVPSHGEGPRVLHLPERTSMRRAA
jgi:MYXO-CTERM domain-containing protein